VLAYENLLENQAYAKLQGLMGEEVFIRHLPVLVGALTQEKLHPNEI